MVSILKRTLMLLVPGWLRFRLARLRHRLRRAAAATPLLRAYYLHRLQSKFLAYAVARPYETRLAQSPLPEQPTHVGLRSKPCTQEDIESDWFRYWCGRMHIAPAFHRKLWEFCYVAQALHERGMLREGARGIGFGCGEEPLPSLFASCGVSVLATDLPPTDSRSQTWSHSGQHAQSLERLKRPEICPPERLESITLEYVDMNRIPEHHAGQFDFCWSACALEHLGSIEHGLQFMANTAGLLRPGGVLVHTTEFNYLSDTSTVDNWPTVLFTRRHFRDAAARLEHAGCTVEALDFDLGSGALDGVIDLPPYERDNDWPVDMQQVHLRLVVEGYAATSFGIIAARNSGA
jgi:SAM-dependent methyltransferase